MTATAQSAPPAPGLRRTVAVAGFGTLLVMAVFTAPLATPRELAADLGAGPAGQTWILSAMSLGLTVAMLTAGALADDFGRRRVFRLGAVVLLLASVVSALATVTWLFVFARILAGLGAAAVLACSLALIGQAAPSGPHRAQAMGRWGASLSLGLALGPVLAALATEFLDWRVMYWVLVLGGAVLVTAARGLTESVSGHRRPLDLPGVLLLAAGLAALLAGLTLGRGGWLAPATLTLLGGGLLLLLGFLLRQAFAAEPMIELSLFRSRGLLSATVASFAAGAGVTALMSFLPIVLQRALGLGLITTSVLVVVWSGTSAVAALAVRRLHRLDLDLRLGLGMIILAVGLFALVAPSRVGQGLDLLPGLLIAGIGTGISNASLGVAAVAGVPPAKAGLGGGLNQTVRYLGAAIGVTVVFALSVRSAGAPISELLDGWRASVYVCAGVTLLGGVAALALRPRASR
ncbi:MULTISPECIES: MFS transporter [unclassified Crossiella]|uniref:MFS transporter n=1 Tax=unclassified Crossiella TaxID=2620835 RepID=UPI0020002B67|nr:MULTISPECIES: MFS transporter [unclassified Crossiella]MCK2239200.1 MFS transporter [Crossiella sp. S99.2]MCK2251231.1 MFS transporter [Crossiella sp. S99.1]